MNKVLKWSLIVIVGLVIIAFAFFQWMIYDTKKHSPEDTVTYTKGDLSLEVFYNRPSKKDRVIFGELVPYGQVWRTGANEATTFETNKSITIAGNQLPKGKYTLWTVPNESSWDVIFNSKMYDWGVNFDGTSIKEDNADVLTVSVPVEKLPSSTEQFTISIDEGAEGTRMSLEWDDVRVYVPIQ